MDDEAEIRREVERGLKIQRLYGIASRLRRAHEEVGKRYSQLRRLEDMQAPQQIVQNEKKLLHEALEVVNRVSQGLHELENRLIP